MTLYNKIKCTKALRRAIRRIKRENGTESSKIITASQTRRNSTFYILPNITKFIDDENK